MQRSRPFPEEQTVVSTGAADYYDKVFRAPQIPGTLGVRLDSIAVDNGVIAGTPLTKVQIKVTPKQQADLCGGDVYHTYAALDTYKQNVIPFGVMLRPGEDLTVRVLNGGAGTNVVRVNRTVIYEDGQAA